MSLAKLVFIGVGIAAAAIAFVMSLNPVFQTNFPGFSNSTSFTSDNPESHVDTPHAKEYPLPDGTWPNGMAVARDGKIWLAGTKSNTLLSFDPGKGGIESSFPITESKETPDKAKEKLLMVWTMIEDGDGSIWFSQAGGKSQLWRFDPVTEAFSAIKSVSAAPMQMKADQKTGDIWFTTFSANTVGVIQKMENGVEGDRNSSDYSLKEFYIGKDTFPSGLFLKDDSVWVTQSLTGKVAKYNIEYDDGGSVVNITKSLEIPDDELLFTPTDLALVGNSIWLTEHNTSFVTEYDTSSQTVKRYPTSLHPLHSGTLPYWMRASTNGDGFWFNEHRGNRIAFFNTTDITLTEYEVPTRDPESGYIANALNIATDPVDKDKVWFSEFNMDKIGVVDRSKPIPFTINASEDRIALSSNDESRQTATVKIDISRITTTNLYNKVLSLKTSSSMNAAAGFVNMTASFSENDVDLTNTNGTASVQLTIRASNDTPVGNYIIGVNATDGTVTKTIYIDMSVVE